jgi:hypothetical protein
MVKNRSTRVPALAAAVRYLVVSSERLDLILFHRDFYFYKCAFFSGGEVFAEAAC